jgi:flagellar basal-body rod modification protein FlgD
VPTTTSTPPASGLPTDQMGRDTFLKLMVAQLRNQDPMNPQDSAEFLAQTAQFTSLEKLDAVAQQTSQALAAQMAFGASTLAGRSVTYLGEDGVTEVSGIVDTVRFTATGPVLSVGGADVPISSVTAVALQEQASA